jgi:hypothetical protein
MALAFVNGVFSTAGSGFSANLSITPASPGHLLVVTITADVITAVFGISDNRSNTWRTCNPSTNDGVDRITQSWYCSNAASGATSITVTSNLSQTFLHIYITEFSGADNSYPFDQHSEANARTGTVIDSGSRTTIKPNEIIYGFIYSNSGDNTIGGTYTLAAGVARGDESVYKIVSSAGSYSVDAVQGSVAVWGATMATFSDTPIPPVLGGPSFSAVGADFLTGEDF